LSGEENDNMKPAPFKYLAPESLAEAITLLERHGETGKVIAGGQSLLPLMNMRLATPEILIDLRNLTEMKEIRQINGFLEIGAMVTHQRILTSTLIQEKCPLLAEAAGHIAHRQVRNRGTIGGSVAHADPAAEFPTVVTALEAEIKIAGPEGEKWLKPAEFFFGFMMTALQPTDILTAIKVPVSPEGCGWSVQELARKENYFAIAGAVCLLELSHKRVAEVHLGIMGCSPAPLKPLGAEEVIRGQELTDDLLEKVADSISKLVEPETDLHGTEAYRREMAGVVAKRALREAHRRIIEGRS
jgi:CO/xanthine dehydrogenase FAD-binding subunit